jgi:Tol biopolymer transport system component
MSFNKVLFAIFVGSAFLLPYIFSNYAAPTKAILGAKTESGSSKNILFVSDKTGNQEIYRMNLDTKKIENLTNNPAIDMHPQVSPDGQFMVFYSNRHGNNDIYRMNLKDLTVTQLTKDSSDDYDPAYAPDGKKIVFSSTKADKLGDIYLMNADGTHQINITPKHSTTEERNPKFSVDGKKIFFVVRNSNGSKLSDKLYSMDIDGSAFTKISNDNVPDANPDINPKNDAILFVSRTNVTAKDDLFLMDATKKMKQVTKLPGNEDNPAWDKSGSRIIFSNDQDGNADLYIMNADGSNIQRIEKTTDDELSPIFIP